LGGQKARRKTAVVKKNCIQRKGWPIPKQSGCVNVTDPKGKPLYRLGIRPDGNFVAFAS
jgi:hypothetical protein